MMMMPVVADVGLQKTESNGNGATCKCCKEKIFKEGSTEPRRCAHWYFTGYGTFKNNDVCGCIVVSPNHHPRNLKAHLNSCKKIATVIKSSTHDPNLMLQTLSM